MHPGLGWSQRNTCCIKRTDLRRILYCVYSTQYSLLVDKYLYCIDRNIPPVQRQKCKTKGYWATRVKKWLHGKRPRGNGHLDLHVSLFGEHGGTLKGIYWVAASQNYCKELKNSGNITIQPTPVRVINLLHRQSGEYNT